MSEIELGAKWGEVKEHLAAEKLKLASYDNTLLQLIGNTEKNAVEEQRNILDYGAGPGVLAYALQQLGAIVRVFDIDPEMRAKAAEKVGQENVYTSTVAIPSNNFDYAICNLVLCIVKDNEVLPIMENIRDSLNDKGTALIGFCNPLIFDAEESRLDFREQTGDGYDVNHLYWKVKKEGDYRIEENHRPIEWYENLFRRAGFDEITVHFTPGYEMNGRKIQDFVIFELIK